MAKVSSPCAGAKVSALVQEWRGLDDTIRAILDGPESSVFGATWPCTSTTSAEAVGGT